jgi:hypothetical protein
MLRRAIAVLALIPLALGAAQQEEFEVLLEDMVEKVSLNHGVEDSFRAMRPGTKPVDCPAENTLSDIALCG